MSIVDIHFEHLKDDYADAEIESRDDGTAVVTIPAVGLCDGWSQEATTIAFIAPVGYPVAQPDCFWAEESLRLANGQLPKNSAVQAPPFSPLPKLWFSWHLAGWNPSRHSLKSYLASIRGRLSQPE